MCIAETRASLLSISFGVGEACPWACTWDTKYEGIVSLSKSVPGSSPSDITDPGPRLARAISD